MSGLFKQINKSRQSYWKGVQRAEQKSSEQASIITHVHEWRDRHPRMGSRVLYYSMKESGLEIPIGVTAFERLLSTRNLTVGTVKRSIPYTSDGLGERGYPNLTNGLRLDDINQLVVADITYFKVKGKNNYLFTFKDVYSQRLISLIPCKSMVSDNAVKALVEFKSLRGADAIKGCIHHSDNGSQYDSQLFKTALLNCKMKISRSTTCQENGSSEQINHIIKNMYLRHFGITTFKELQTACLMVKTLMNDQRSVEQLEYKTVTKFEQMIRKVPPDKRPKKVLYDFLKDT
jgi:putative transposase